jgi:hypothetical protein
VLRDFDGLPLLDPLQNRLQVLLYDIPALRQTSVSLEDTRSQSRGEVIIDKRDTRDDTGHCQSLLEMTMSNILDVITDHLPRVTVEDAVRRFSATVDIRDARAFAAELQAFVHERVEAVELPSSLDVSVTPETVGRSMARKAAALRADSRWTPGETEIQRGRALLLAAFEQPHNLPLPDFARLANKSRQQIYKDIDARRLLALNVGPRRQKLPDWQLDPVKRALTEAVLTGAADVDSWTLYRALSEPLEGLAGRSPVDAVTADSIDDVAKAVFNVLGVH